MDHSILHELLCIVYIFDENKTGLTNSLVEIGPDSKINQSNAFGVKYIGTN